MGGVNFSVHPLFFLFGLYYAFTGRIFIFIVYTLTAIAHELGHSIAAQRRGYRLNKIVLMPFGALISGEDDLSVKDQTAIALAGPLTNLCIGLFFVACWWLFPETYVFTDVAAEANFAIATINFLPVFPLDGGRILYSVLAQKFSKKIAKKVSFAVGIAVAVTLFGLFIASVFFTFNLSLLFFSLFVLFGVIFRGKENDYVRLFSGVGAAKLKRGVPYKKQAIDGSATLMRLIRILDPDAVNEVVVFDEGRKKAILSQEKITEIIKNGDFSAPIKDFL